MNILMPQLGETVAEGKITKWFKSAGDAVKPGDNLFEIETDKVSMEVPATEAGVLSEIRVQEGETAPVGAIVGVIGGAAAGLRIQMQPARPARPGRARCCARWTRCCAKQPSCATSTTSTPGCAIALLAQGRSNPNWPPAWD